MTHGWLPCARLAPIMGGMKDLAPHTIELESEKLQFLQEMSTKYGLADVGKAVRCLVNYARENPDRLDDIFGEVRCLDC